MRVTLHPAAERDLQEAAMFYERDGSPALAARFIKEFRRVTALLTEQPMIGAPRGRGRRGLAMRIFPYTVIYRVRGEPVKEVKVLVVKHNRRRPAFGQTRA